MLSANFWVKINFPLEFYLNKSLSRRKKIKLKVFKSSRNFINQNIKQKIKRNYAFSLWHVVKNGWIHTLYGYLMMQDYDWNGLN